MYSIRINVSKDRKEERKDEHIKEKIHGNIYLKVYTICLLHISYLLDYIDNFVAF